MENSQMQMASLGWLKPSPLLTVEASRVERTPEAPHLEAFLEKSI